MALADLKKPSRALLSSLLAPFHALASNDGTGFVQRLAGMVFFIRVISAIIAYGSQVLLARWMGSFEFGIYVYVWTWVLLLGSCVDLGLASAAQRLIPEYVAHRRDTLLRGFLAASRWLSIGNAVLIGGLCAAVITLARPWLERDVVVPLYLACATLPAYALAQTQSGISRSYDWIGLALAPAFVIRQLLLTVIIGVIYFLGIPVGALAAMIASSMSVWITAVGAVLVLNRRLNNKVHPGPSDYDFPTWLSVSLPIFMTESFFLLHSYVDILMLKQFVTPDDVAVYYAVVKTLAVVSFIHFAVSATTTHRFSRYHFAGERERLCAFLAQTIRWTFWPSLLAIALLLVVGRPLLDLFGAGFSGGYPLMFILAVGLLARAAVGPSERLLSMIGEWRICAFIYLTAFLSNLGMCVVLIPSWGTAGAAIATSIALVVESTLLFLLTRRRLGLGMRLGRQAAS